ncbi:MAG: DUF134 domain-containing protein [bacterium]|nr:DUF134 domain-containing protein [bacterium]
MPRKQCQRRIRQVPGIQYFKPQGIPMTALLEVLLTVDEFEAIRLADLEGRYHAEGGEEMDVSRQTFGRILESARRKVAQALVEGKALRIEGGNFDMREQRTFVCSDCNHRWQVPFGTGRPGSCPECKNSNIHRAPEERGHGRCGRTRREPSAR